MQTSADGRKVPGLLGCLEGLLKHPRKIPLPVCAFVRVCTLGSKSVWQSARGGGGVVGTGMHSLLVQVAPPPQTEQLEWGMGD